MKKITLILLISIFVFSLFSYSFGNNKIQYKEQKWSRIETLHFDIYYPDEDPEFGEIAALIAEDAYFYLKKDFRTPVVRRMSLFFYKSHKDFETTNIIYPLLNEGVGGFTESVKNRVVVPFDGSFRKMEEIVIHELTHAYINELNKNVSRIFEGMSFPFWMQEGLPEFMAVGGDDIYNNMFIVDLLMNDGVHNLDEIWGYYAYRQGESFLVFINEVYGRDKVMELFYTTRVSGNPDTVYEQVFDMKFEEIQKRWKNYLKRRYFPYITEYDVPYEVFEPKTGHEEDNSYINFAPRFSPDGETYLYFSNKDMRTNIWKGSTLELHKNKKLIKGETTGKMEEFHFLRNNFSWFPEGDRFTFVAKTSFGDRIYIADLDSGKITQEFPFPGFDAVFEVDVSHSGKKIVFTGQKNLKNDIYILDLETEEIQQITNDKYNDYQPRWSPDDSKIVFSSERTILENNEHVFYGLNTNIFYYDVENADFYNVTNDNFNNSFPFWNSTGEFILFSSERELVLNLETVNITTGQRARITKSLGGIFAADIDSNDENLIFSCFYKGGWDVYTKANPLFELDFYDFKKPNKIELKDDFYTQFKIERYKTLGKVDRKFKKIYPVHNSKNVTKIDFGNKLEQDSLNHKYNEELDTRPTEENVPKVYPYKTKFMLDRLWGGMAYSASAGAYGQVMLGFTDLMGNHSFGVNMGITRNLENSDFVFNYLYLKKRIDYGGGVFYLNDDVIWSFLYTGGNEEYMRERIKKYGLFGMIRYPLNKFWKIDFEGIIQQEETRRDMWNEYSDTWIEEYVLEDITEQYGFKTYEKETNFLPQISLVQDNTLYGSVGPIAGWRGALMVGHSFTNNNDDYTIGVLDYRQYLFFAKKYAFAFRTYAGVIEGDTNLRFDLADFDGVRGFDGDILGKKKALASAELRFPFIDHLQIGFPLPIQFANIRGSAFVDVGAVWNDNSDLKLAGSGVLKDMKMGFGFGPRINLGFFILKFDIAWETDLKDVSKPSYYFILSPDF
jgi:hypothetical protein